MKETIIDTRLKRVRQLADNNLEKLEKVLPSKGEVQPLYSYLPQAVARARQDPAFAAQLADAMNRYNALHQAVWGKAKK